MARTRKTLAFERAACGFAPPSAPKACEAASGLNVLGLVALTLLVRVGVLLLVPDALSADPDGYRCLAGNLLRHGTFGHEQAPTAYRPPLYPLMLVPCAAMGPASRVAIGALHVLLGLATVVLVFRLARRLELGRYAVVAAVLVAYDPILLAQSTLVMTETLATFLIVAALVCLTAVSERPTAVRAAAAGVVSAAAALCRPGLLLWTFAAALLLPVSIGPTEQRSRRVSVFGSFAIAAAVVLVPWVVRNQIQFGRPILTTTHGGYTLLLGNNPWFYEYLRSGRPGSVWDADELHRTRTVPADELRDELRADRADYAEACRNIRREPGMFCYSCLVRVGRLWQLLPHQTVTMTIPSNESPLHRLARYAVGLWYLVELSLAAVGVWAVWPKKGPGLICAKHPPGRSGKLNLVPFSAWATLLAGCVTAIHVFYWANMRMRAPLMPVVALAAAAGLAWLIARRPPGFDRGESA